MHFQHICSWTLPMDFPVPSRTLSPISPQHLKVPGGVLQSCTVGQGAAHEIIYPSIQCSGIEGQVNGGGEDVPDQSYHPQSQCVRRRVA